jgi:release factor glutamine methyltransferase
MGKQIFVDERVFIPRPETELLVKSVFELLKKNGKKQNSILELCAGSGVISIALADLAHNCSITAVDICPAALEVALKNITARALEEKISLIRSDLYENLERTGKTQYDCIIANPPYVSKRDYEKVDPWVKAEPEIALLAGEQGLDCIERIIGKARNFLVPGGFLALEIGYDQSLKVKDLFFENCFSEVRSFKDFNGYERVITGWTNG